MIILLIIIVGFIGLGILQTVKKAQFKKALVSAYADLSSIVPNFIPDKVYNNLDGLCMIALDAKQKQLQIAHKLPDVKVNLFKRIPYSLIALRASSFRDILKCEMIIDKQVITNKSAGGALAGGLLFGTTGAVIGNNTGKTKYSKEIKAVTLKLIFNNIADPSCEMLFYEKGFSTNSPEQAQQDCLEWVDTFFVAANQLD